MEELVPAVAFPPGDYLLEILEDRGWSHIDFAAIIGRSVKLVNEIVRARTSISPTTAKEIAAATDTSPMLWLNLETAYRLHSDQGMPSPRIARHAKLRLLYPVREMVRRDWIGHSSDPEVLEEEVKRYFGINDLDEQPRLQHAAKKTGYPSDINGPQLAWLFRVKQIAESMAVRPYSPRLLRSAMQDLRALLVAAEDVRRVPHILAEAGVRLVIVEPVPGSKIDGVTFWVGDNGASPVIGLSLRLDRIDNFWFVLAHEIAHVLNGHGRDEAIIDFETFEPNVDSHARNLSTQETLADTEAQEFCVPRAAMADFILRNRPLFSEEKVVGFARRMQVHPGLVVGQLQRAMGNYRMFRKHLEGVRGIIVPVAMTDGYGQVVPVNL